MQHPSLASWWDLPGWAGHELSIYFVVVGAMTTALVGIMWVCALLLRRVGVSGGFAFDLAGCTSVLLVAAYLCGAPADLAFVALYRYHAYGPGDPLIDWIPFFPTGGWVVTESEGGMFINGGTPEQLTAAWRVLAVPVWCAAGGVTVWIMQLREAASRRLTRA